MAKEKGFWDKFDDLMKSIPKYIESQTKDVYKDKIPLATHSYSSSTSTVVQNGHVTKTKTVNGKTTMTIDGEEVVPKYYADKLLEAVEENKTFYGETTYPYKMMVKAVKQYKKYLGDENV